MTRPRAELLDDAKQLALDVESYEPGEVGDLLWDLIHELEELD